MCQGGVLSAGLYKVFSNEHVDQLTISPYGARIGNVKVGSPACADDFVLTSETKEGLQIQLGISENCSNKRRFIIHPIKTVAVKPTERNKK